MRGAALAALDRPAMALGPKETAEVELGAAFFTRLAELVSATMKHSDTLESSKEGLAKSCPTLGRVLLVLFEKCAAGE